MVFLPPAEDEGSVVEWSCVSCERERPSLAEAMRRKGRRVGRLADMTAQHISMSVQTRSGKRV